MTKPFFQHVAAEIDPILATANAQEPDETTAIGRFQARILNRIQAQIQRRHIAGKQGATVAALIELRDEIRADFALEPAAKGKVV